MSALTQEAARLRRQQITAESINYVFHLKLMYGELFEGIAEVQFHLASVTGDIMLDYSGDDVLMLLVNGMILEKPERRGMSIVLPWKNLIQGLNHASVIFRSRYDREGVGCISHTDNDNKQYIYTYFEPCSANRAVPIFDQPDLKAKMYLNIIAPPSWKVASNQTPGFRNKFDLNKYLLQFGAGAVHFSKFFIDCEQATLHCFPPTELLPSYLFCWIAGDYLELNCPNPYRGMSMNIFCTPRMAGRVEKHSVFMWELTVAIIEFYENLFGCPYPFKKYEFALVETFRVLGMEHPGLVTINSVQFFGERAVGKLMFKIAQTLSHEIAHSWFGNLTTMKWWDDLWLKESFADFVSFICLERIQKKITSYRYAPSMLEFFDRKAWGYKQDQIDTTHPIRAEVPNTEVAESIFDGITYSKGAAVLSQLMFVMGDQNFAAANAAFFKKYAWKNASFDDLINIMQQHFSNEHFTLAQWKQLWLERACLNEIEAVWDESSRSETAFLRIRQSWVLPEHTTLRMHKIQVAFYRNDCKADVLDCLVMPQEWTTIAYNASRQYCAVLPNFGDHTFVKVCIDPVSLSFFRKNFSRIDDSLTRAMLWSIFFNMVSEARIPSTEFVEFFISNIAQEGCEGVFTNQFDAVWNAIGKFTPYQYREELGDRVFFFLTELLVKSGEDQQRIDIIQAKLINFLFSDRARKTLVEWWAGKYMPLLGVKMGFLQEWEAVTSIFALSDSTAEQRDFMMNSLLSRTNPASVDYYINKCAALRATKEQFETLYQSYKDPAGKPKQGSMSGFTHPVHLEWIEQFYTDRYFLDLVEIAETMPSDASVRFLQELQPINRNTDRLIEGYEQLIPKIRKYERLAKDASQILHDLKKRNIAYKMFISKKK